MDVATLSAIASNSVQVSEVVRRTTDNYGVYFERWQFVLLLITAIISGPISVYIGQMMQAYRTKVSTRRKIAEDILSDLFELYAMGVWEEIRENDLPQIEMSDREKWDKWGLMLSRQAKIRACARLYFDDKTFNDVDSLVKSISLFTNKTERVDNFDEQYSKLAKKLKAWVELK